MDGGILGDEFKGYIFKITGGNDKQGFAMMQGVIVKGRTRLLLRKVHPCFRPRKRGQFKRKTIRGCIVGPDIIVINLVIVKKGQQDIPGLTDVKIPRRLGPKRASKIRKLYGAGADVDVRKLVVRRPISKGEGKKTVFKSPKIQRLVTDTRLRRKKLYLVRQAISQAAPLMCVVKQEAQA